MSDQVGFKSFENDSVSIHAPISPMEIYDTSVTALITFSNESSFERAVSVKVISISPVGAEFDVSSLSNPTLYSAGDSINVKISTGGSVSSFFGLLISDDKNRSGKRIIGVRWCEKVETSQVNQERRTSNRWLCSDSFLPNGIAPNPARFNDFIYFKVLDISKDGMQITTSMRNKLVIPGMVMDSILNLPLIGEANISFKILNVRIKEEGGKDLLILGVQFLKPTLHFFEKISQYLLQFGRNVSPLELINSGLVPKSVNSAVEFSYVKDADTYKEVLALRRATYTKSNLEINPEEDMKWADYYDSKSRIIVAKHFGKCVGTVRLTFHEPNEKTEYHEYVSFPESFPNSSDLLVSGRLCTSPDYRGKDLFDGLIRQMVQTGLQSKRRYILGCSEDTLLHLYERIGLKRTGITFTRNYPRPVNLEVLCMDVSATVVGRGIKFKWWRRVYSDLYRYIDDFKDFEISPLDRVRVKTFVFLDKLLKVFGL